MILLDSDHLSVLTDLRHKRRSILISRLEATAEARAVPIIVVEEHLRGWLAQIRRVQDPYQQIVPYLRLANLFDFFVDWTIVGWNEHAADQFNTSVPLVFALELKTSRSLPSHSLMAPSSSAPISAISSKCLDCESKVGWNSYFSSNKNSFSAAFSFTVAVSSLEIVLLYLAGIIDS